MLDVNHIVSVLSRISKIDIMPSDIAFLLDYLQADMSWEPFLAVAEGEGVDGLLYT